MIGSVVNTFFEERLDQIVDLARRIHELFADTSISYRVVGGLAVYFHVESRKPAAGRLTRDLDVAVDREDLARIAAAAPRFGFKYRHAAGLDLLVETEHPSARRGVHFVFVREKVRPEYVEPVPDFSEPARTAEGILLAPVADLVRMKLTSFRLRDKVHVQDLDNAGLITNEIEASLSEILRVRLAEVRASE